jgi:hypothetical protein
VIAIAVLAAAAAGGLRVLGIGTGLELESVDARFRLRGSLKPPAEVVLVQVDEKTLSDLHRRWPFLPFPAGAGDRSAGRGQAARHRIDLQYTSDHRPRRQRAHRRDPARRPCRARHDPR